MTYSDPVNASAVSQGSLELRAYQLYEERGRTDGHALDDWLAAEAERTQHLADAIVGHSDN